MFTNHLAKTWQYKWYGVWLWNDSLWHYVKNHSFCVPNKLVERILYLEGNPPTEINIPLEELPWP